MIENSQLLEYIGETKTKNLVKEIQNEYFETIAKNYPQKENPVHNIKANALVTILKNKDEIKSIGMSCINDLINDNFGNFWGSLLSRFTNPILKDQTNVNRQVLVYAQSDSFADTDGGHALGCQMEIGSGVTIPARTDFNLNSVIGGLFSPVGNAGYNSGLGQVQVTGNSAVLIGSGSISEAGLYGRWRSSSTTRLFLLSRDLISPVVPYVNGEVATVEYTFQL